MRATTLVLLLTSCRPTQQVGHNDPDAGVDGAVDAAPRWPIEFQDSAIKLNAVWGSGPTDIYAVGVNGFADLILHSTGDGHWVEQPVGINGELYSIWGSGPNDVYVGGFGNTLLHSTGNGVWSLQTIPNIGVLEIWGSGPSDVYITFANSAGTVYHSTGNGTWSPFVVGDSTSIIATVWGPSATDVYFAGGNTPNDDAPYVVHGPSNLTSQTLPPPPDMYKRDIFQVWGSGPNDLYAGGNSDGILHSDGGGTWTQQTGPQGGSTFLGIWGSGPNDVYMISDQVGVYHSTGNGTWIQDPDVHNRPMGIWGSSSHDIYIVGNSILHETH